MEVDFVDSAVRLGRFSIQKPSSRMLRRSGPLRMPDRGPHPTTRLIPGGSMNGCCQEHLIQKVRQALLHKTLSNVILTSI